MIYVVSIDPGDVHVGWATWFRSNGSSPASRMKAGELAADDAVRNIDRWLARAGHQVVRQVVIEKFTLYANKAQDQAGSDMKTSQMIGALKWVAGTYNAEVFEQGADIQKPTEAQLVARGIPLIVGGPHAKSAQLHLIHHLLKEGLWK